MTSQATAAVPWWEAAFSHKVAEMPKRVGEKSLSLGTMPSSAKKALAPSPQTLSAAPSADHGEGPALAAPFLENKTGAAEKRYPSTQFLARLAKQVGSAMKYSIANSLTAMKRAPRMSERKAARSQAPRRAMSSAALALEEAMKAPRRSPEKFSSRRLTATFAAAGEQYRAPSPAINRVAPGSAEGRAASPTLENQMRAGERFRPSKQFLSHLSQASSKFSKQNVASKRKCPEHRGVYHLLLKQSE